MKRYISCFLALLTAVSAFASCSSGETESGSASAAETTAAAAESTAENETPPADEAPAEEEDSPYTLNGDFSKGESAKFMCSDGWSNGNMFNCTWKRETLGMKETPDDGPKVLLNVTF